MRNKEILIIGGGYSALRYVESLIWNETVSITLCGMEVKEKTRELARHFSLPYISFRSLDKSIVQRYDCIIVSVALEGKRLCLERMNDLEYGGAWLVEKPLAITTEDLNYYIKILSNKNKCAVVCQRDFLESEYFIPPAEEYRIIFPSYEKDPKFNIINMLPHIISWLISVDDSLESLCALDSSGFGGIWRGRDVVIQITDRDSVRCTVVNKTEYPNIQYRKVNSYIVEQVMNYKQEESEASLNRAVKVSKIIIQLLEDLKL